MAFSICLDLYPSPSLTLFHMTIGQYDPDCPNSSVMAHFWARSGPKLGQKENIGE